MRNRRLRKEIKRDTRAPFFLATVTAVDTTGHTITVQEGDEPPYALPAAMGTYPEVGALVLVLMNGDDPVVLNQLATDDAPGGGPIGGGWSAKQSWMPRMALLDYDTATWTEPDYGDPDDTSKPSIRDGWYRTNGDAFAWRAVVLFGEGAQSAYDTGTNHTDYVIYLSIPFALDDDWPAIPDAANPDGLAFNEFLYGYDLGYSPLAGLTGTATWAQGGGERGYTGGQLIRPPWSQNTSGFSFPSDPPADVDEWIAAIALDTTSIGDTPSFGSDPGPGLNIWAWESSEGQDIRGPAPLPLHVVGDASTAVQPGTLVTWAGFGFRRTS